jgi:Carbonic anhydrase
VASARSTKHVVTVADHAVAAVWAAPSASASPATPARTRSAGPRCRGVADFRQRKQPQLQDTFRDLARSQNPATRLITCSDSRIVSGLLFGADPGDLFEVRTYGVVTGALARNAVELHSAWFDIGRRQLHAWRAAEQRFVRLDAGAVARALERKS